MLVPKVIFKPMTLEQNIETIKWAFYENNEELSVHDYTIEYFPELSKIDSKATKEEVYQMIDAVVTKEYNKYKNRIVQEVERYNNIWSKYNDNYFSTLSMFLGVEFPHNIKTIDAYVGLIPVFPRYLDTLSFSISTGVEEWKLIETTAHETLHFLWFEKWKTIYPQTPKRHFDSPYIEWKYSEMVTDPILNNKPFSDMFGSIFVERGYNYFYDLKDGDNLVMDNLRLIYSENIPIEDKIAKGFEYVSKILEDNHKQKKQF